MSHTQNLTPLVGEDSAKGALGQQIRHLAAFIRSCREPAYPALLMRAHIEGTVTLYAVIRADGSVGEVRVLRGVDDRLDGYARDALTRCRFRPATKNGSAVALEAVIRIPFEANRIGY